MEMPVSGLSPRPRYALLMNGSRFARAVLQALGEQGLPPDLLVLPQYPPASEPGSVLFADSRQESRLSFSTDIDTAYAPRTQQAQLARRLQGDGFEILLVACWPYLVSQEVIESVSRAALNLHPSMLPDYRGPDPIGAQLEAAELRPGVSLHFLSQVFDAGDILARTALPEQPGPLTRSSLEDACARSGVGLFVDALRRYDSGWQPLPQALLESPEPDD